MDYIVQKNVIDAIIEMKNGNLSIGNNHQNYNIIKYCTCHRVPKELNYYYSSVAQQQSDRCSIGRRFESLGSFTWKKSNKDPTQVFLLMSLDFFELREGTSKNSIDFSLFYQSLLVFCVSTSSNSCLLFSITQDFFDSLNI